MSLADDLEMLGAEGLAGQYVTLRVKSIDKKKLAQALGGVKAAAVPAALALVDLAPEQALQLLLPLGAEQARARYGVDLEYRVTDVPPPPLGPGEKRKGSGTAGKVLLGVGLGALGAYAASHFGALGAGRNLLHKVGL